MNKKKSPPSPHRGEIWLIDWSPGRGSEQVGRRPAVIIQNDIGNLSSKYLNTMVAAISTKGRDIPLHVSVQKSARNGLKSDSYVKCEQVLTISKSRLVGKAWGRLTSDQMMAVNAALRISMDLP